MAEVELESSCGFNDHIFNQWTTLLLLTETSLSPNVPGYMQILGLSPQNTLDLTMIVVKKDWTLISTHRYFPSYIWNGQNSTEVWLSFARNLTGIWKRFVVAWQGSLALSARATICRPAQEQLFLATVCSLPTLRHCLGRALLALELLSISDCSWEKCALMSGERGA